MTRKFQVRDLTLHGAREHHTYQFRPGVNVIVGPVGSGKTSLLELLKYTMGGSATLSPAVQELVQSTAMTVAFDTRVLVLSRHVGSSTVTVHIEDAVSLGDFATQAGRPNEPISDLLLEALRIPSLRIPRSRRRPSGASSRLTFFDVYAYLYLSQTEIDRSVVDHLDSYREPKRRATFELLYGLSNATLLDLEVQRGELLERQSNLNRRADETRSFLEAAGQPSVDQLRREREHVAAALEAAVARRSGLQQETRSVTEDADPVRERVRGLETVMQTDRERRDELTATVSRLRALSAQLELDEQRVGRAVAAGTVLSGLDFAICPRCLQPVQQGRADDGSCYVCLQPEQIGDPEGRLEEERRRLTAQRHETLDLLREDEAALERVNGVLEEREGSLADLRNELDRATASYVSSRFSLIQQTGEEVGRLRALRAALQQVAQLWEQHGSIQSEIGEVARRISDLNRDIAEARASLTEGTHRVVTLSDLFAETLTQFQLPWLESAAIDLETYLPVVNGRSFEELSSGGMKTLVNGAYHMAALRYAMVYDDSMLPLLQVIDSPRKNLGSGPEDRQLSANLYRRIRALQDAFNDNFQMIIADNDLPEVARDFPTISLDYDTPGVPFAVHPGPEHVQSIGA